jgi:hypothetical protein
MSGGVVVIAINLESSASSFVMDAFAMAPRLEYQLTAPGGDMSSQQIMLNGVVLTATSEGVLPPLNGTPVTEVVPIELAATSYGFFVFPAANATACYA